MLAFGFLFLIIPNALRIDNFASLEIF